jgi:fucose 4-O-acetylase-like acetyltransferase
LNWEFEVDSSSVFFFCLFIVLSFIILSVVHLFSFSPSSSIELLYTSGMWESPSWVLWVLCEIVCDVSCVLLKTPSLFFRLSRLPSFEMFSVEWFDWRCKQDYAGDAKHQEVQ